MFGRRKKKHVKAKKVKKGKKIKKIYTPRPGYYSDEDDHEVEDHVMVKILKL